MVSSALRGNGTNPGRRGASPKGACRVEYRGTAIGHPKVLPGAASGDQAELPGPRGGLGAVGGAELAQDVGHVLLTVSSATTRSWAMRWFDLPAASSRSTSSSRP